RMIAVSALEETPRLKTRKKDGKPLHWMLLTTEGEAGIETARTVLRWYELRIERFFHALKVGTRIEDRRLDEANDLKKCLAFDMITAFRVWDLSLLARERPNDPAERHVTREDITALCALAAHHGFKVPRVNARGLFDGAVFALFDGDQLSFSGSPGGVSHGHQRVKPLRGSFAPPFG
ncbi:MAG: hypothetical protein OXE76_04460, partial [Alphaproteobacteria bacterium]|nr:hypothetical protein [Alphaproteobacteria bacterium]